MVAALLALPAAVPASPVTFTVDSSQSSLTLSGAAFGLAVNPQAGHTGSLVDAWGGTITADLSGGVLTFSGGSAITALLNPSAPFSTTPYPTVPPGSVDNYGVFASGLVNGVGLVLGMNGAYRSMTLDLNGGTATDGLAPSTVNMVFTAGHLEWGAIVSPNTPFGGTSSLVNVGGLDTSAANVSFDGTTLILPVQLHTTGSNRYEDWSGVIVAVVPEPSSMALAVMGVGLLAWRKRVRS